MQVIENTAEHLWEVIYFGNNFFEHFFKPIKEKAYIIDSEQMKKYKTTILLITLTISLILTVRGKTYIEKITNIFLYSDITTKQ